MDFLVPDFDDCIDLINNTHFSTVVRGPSLPYNCDFYPPLRDDFARYWIQWFSRRILYYLNIPFGDRLILSFNKFREYSVFRYTGKESMGFAPKRFAIPE